ncbi:unnamed protein product [Ilex paraguariensis]|uniref:Uncharacterized protein n=1 Tax=Ilex paraguariensis TaxID=185542 RepID=A0ABC8UND6_9AQUA
MVSLFCNRGAELLNVFTVCFYYALLQFHNVLYGDAKGCAKRLIAFVHPYVPGVMNPHAKVVQQWNKFFVISCLVAIFLDPVFFFLLSVRQVWIWFPITWLTNFTHLFAVSVW